jgi:hypothetical protein
MNVPSIRHVTFVYMFVLSYCDCRQAALPCQLSLSFLLSNCSGVPQKLVLYHSLIFVSFSIERRHVPPTKTRVIHTRASFITMPLVASNHSLKDSGSPNSHSYLPQDGASATTRIRCLFLNHLHRDLEQVPVPTGFFSLPHFQDTIIYNNCLSADSAQFADCGLSSFTSHSARLHLVKMKIYVHKHCSEGRVDCMISAVALGFDNKNNVMVVDDETAPPKSEPKGFGTGFSITWSYREDDKHSIRMEDMDFEEVLRLCRRQANIRCNSFGEFRSSEESFQIEKEVGPIFGYRVEELAVAGDNDGSSQHGTA